MSSSDAGSLLGMDQRIGFLDFEERKVAYATVGEGPVIVFPAWWVSHIEREWKQPAFRSFFGALAATHTVLRYDRVGVGLSDRQREASEMSLPSEVALLEAIVDELDIETFSLVGISCGGCIGAAYSTRHPERVTELVIYAGYAEGAALAPAQVRASLIDIVRSTWGFGSRVLMEVFMPGADADERREYIAFQRAAASADVAADLLALTFAIDARPDLARVQVPTTVVHRTGDRTIPFLQGREVATLVHGARLVPLPGYTHHPWRGDGAGTAAAITSALGVTGSGGSSESTEALTEREREVLALVARGFSDALIAEHLVLSPHTVHRHIANIRGKLNLSSRSAAAAFAARAGLA
jgi:pimeloyl-ACP methyl ester carboxylesterase/DNA-binding CsgD family transcriptional regulator